MDELVEKFEGDKSTSDKMMLKLNKNVRYE